MPPEIKHAFNHAAHTYNAAANAQHAAGARLVQCLPNNAYARILDLGCGTGFTTHTLANALTFETFEAVDIADAALMIARDECKAHPIQFTEADFNHYHFANNFDLIFSNMAFHWADHLQKIMMHCYQSLNDNGILAFSIPLADTFHELNGITAKRTHPDLAHVLSLLPKTHFELLHHETKQYQTTHQNTLACLRAIKQTGATFVSQETQTSLTKKLLREKNITQLTYDIGFFIGQKTC